MATWDETEVGTATLKIMGIVGTGQTAKANDLARIYPAYTSMYRRLRRLGLAPWPIDAVDDEAQYSLAKLMAGEVAEEFGFSGQRLSELQVGGGSGFAALQQVSGGSKHSTRAKPSYF